MNRREFITLLGGRRQYGQSSARAASCGAGDPILIWVTKSPKKLMRRII
jgi:hypothetical protein